MPILSNEEAPNLGTLRYSESTEAMVPQNLAGLSRRRGNQLSDRLLKGWRILLRPMDRQSTDGPLGEPPHTPDSLPVGSLASPSDGIGVLRYQPMLYAHANLQEYRARRKREEQIGRAVLGAMAAAITVSVGVVLFVHPSPHRGAAIQIAGRPLGPEVPRILAVKPVQTKYAIHQGDTLSQIAEKHHVKLKDLLAANAMTPASKLRIGRELLIPGTRPAIAVPPLPGSARGNTTIIETAARPFGTRLAQVPPPPTLVPKPVGVNPEFPRSINSKPAMVVPAVARPFAYTVRKRDITERIALRFHVQPETILFHNKLNSNSVLRPGQVLKIPPADGYYHTVRRGETLGKLLRDNDIKAVAFRKYNPGIGVTLKRKQVVFLPGEPPKVGGAPAKARKGDAFRNRKHVSRSFFGDVGRAIAGAFHWPMPSRAISSGFGDRHGDFHPGLDIRAPIGTPIRASRDGIVVHAGWEGGYGKMVDISHGGGVITRYAHASSLNVHPGERVSAGEMIGRVGMTGHSTGPHLHYEVRINGRPVNPKKVH